MSDTLNTTDDTPALGRFFGNLRRLPKNLYDSMVRHGKPTTDRVRSQKVFGNVFLHAHPTRVHVRSLRFLSTCGLGVAGLASFLVLLGTGILLMVYHKPSVELAYNSIKDIHYVVPVGRFMRNAHRWAAHLMVVVVILHMARVFYTASYKGGRQFNWVIGMMLLVLTLGLSFTGYLLPWDQLAYWATTIGANIAQSPRELTDALGITAVFDVGGFQKRLLLGSDNVGQDAMTRFYLLHVMVLPLALGLVLAAHLWRVRKDGGLARPDDQDATPVRLLSGQSVDFAPSPTKTYGLMALVRGKSGVVDRGPEGTVAAWPTAFYAIMAVTMVTFAITLFLALGFDAPLKEPANPAVPENPAKAPWYFLGLQELVSYSAFAGGLVAPLVVCLCVGLIPYLDRERESGGVWFSNRSGVGVFAASLVFGAVVVIGMEALAIRFGWLRNWFPGISQIWIILLNPGTIFVVLFALWSFWAMRRGNSTRLGAIAMFTCFLVAFTILTYVATIHRGPNWSFYWSPSQWPTH
jgi:cytochrome b-561